MLGTHSLPLSTPAFHEGDSVFLARGTYQGTIGTFLNFKDDDPKWADIREGSLQVRSHPVEWLEHSRQTAC